MDLEAAKLYFIQTAEMDQYFLAHQSSWDAQKASREIQKCNAYVFQKLLKNLRDKGFCQPSSGLPEPVNLQYEASIRPENCEPFTISCEFLNCSDKQHVLRCDMCIDTSDIVSKEIAFYVTHSIKQYCAGKLGRLRIYDTEKYLKACRVFDQYYLDKSSVLVKGLNGKYCTCESCEEENKSLLDQSLKESNILSVCDVRSSSSVGNIPAKQPAASLPLPQPTAAAANATTDHSNDECQAPSTLSYAAKISDKAISSTDTAVPESIMKNDTRTIVSKENVEEKVPSVNISVGRVQTPAKSQATAACGPLHTHTTPHVEPGSSRTEA